MFYIILVHVDTFPRDTLNHLPKKCPQNSETGFAKRFQAMLRFSWHQRSWHVIVADPGSGKTMGIRDLVKTAGSKAVLAIVIPKNNDDEQALGDQLYTALGLQLRGHWRTRKPKLMGHLHQYGTEGNHGPGTITV